MNIGNFQDVLKEKRLIVIGRRLPPDLIVELVGALVDNGICFFEATFDQALKDPITANQSMISKLFKKFGSRMFIGTGTVLNVNQVQASYEAGASFIVSPNVDEAVIAETKRLDMFSIAGAMTPTEIVRAYNSGADIVKLFPADDLGYHFIKNLRGPLPHIPLIASGGVNPQTIPLFFEAGIDYVSTGMSILKPELIKTNKFEEIGHLAIEHINSIITAKSEGTIRT